MRATAIHYITSEFLGIAQTTDRQLPNGRWVPARFSGTRTGPFERAYAAWLVFTGRADAMVWMEDYYRSEHSNGERSDV